MGGHEKAASGAPRSQIGGRRSDRGRITPGHGSAPDGVHRMETALILVTRLNGPALALNADLIERAEATPDTVLTLVDGTKFVVEESIDELIERMRMHRAAVLAYASEIERGTGQPPQSGPRLRVIPGSEERS